MSMKHDLFLALQIAIRKGEWQSASAIADIILDNFTMYGRRP
jgi:hypothetical protein